MISKDYKPSGYNSVSPYLIVSGAQKLMDLLKDLFQAVELRRYDKEGGAIMHAEIRLDDSVIMLADSTDEFSPTTMWLHVYVSDSQAVYKKAIELGCEGIEAPVNKEGDPDVRGTFKDFAGNFWAVSTQVH